MATNPYKNKVVYNGQILMDITDTTATADKVFEGYTFYAASGQKLVGTGESGIDGDNLAYGVALVGTAQVGTAVAV